MEGGVELVLKAPNNRHAQRAGKGEAVRLAVDPGDGHVLAN